MIELSISAMTALLDKATTTQRIDMAKRGYDLLAKEYYDDFHITCRNFDNATRAAIANANIQISNLSLTLEVGCGRGRCTEFLGIPSDKIIQLDSSRDMLALKNRETCLLRVHADAASVPLFDGQFGVVAGFLIDPFIGLNFFAETYRLLAHDGLFLATTLATEWGYALRGNTEPEASYARFITKDQQEIEVPSTLIPKDKLIEMLGFIGFQSISVTLHCLPRDCRDISPDIQKPADRLNIDVYTLPIVYLIQATRP